MARHGVFVSEEATGVLTPSQTTSGIPFVVGFAPLTLADAETRAAEMTPCLITSFEEAQAKLGYSEDWADFSICEFVYHHFKLCAQQPVIVVPLRESTVSEEKTVTAGNDRYFTITGYGNGRYPAEISLSPAHYQYTYDATTGKVSIIPSIATNERFYVTYNAGHDCAQNSAAAAEAVDKIDLCMAMYGIIPDLIVAPGFSQESTVAAAMAAKAGAINGSFKGRAIVDIEAASYTAAVTAKNSGSYDENAILCWPCGSLGGKVLHGSTIEAGRIAMTDTDNSGVPYESPSNKSVSIDGLCLSDGTEVILTKSQGDILNAAGINTFINFLGGWKAWGNVTGCYPTSTDVKDYLIPIARMFDWVGNSLIKTFWTKVDNPMNRRLIDTILDSANIWLNGLVGRGYLLGGRVEMSWSENSLTDLMAGKITLHVYLTPPSPAQEIAFKLEYDANYVSAALTA